MVKTFNIVSSPLKSGGGGGGGFFLKIKQRGGEKKKWSKIEELVERGALLELGGFQIVLFFFRKACFH